MRRAGFTLIEVLAVVMLTAIVFGVALNFYVDLSNQSQRATDSTRDLRRAASLLDRVAQDFERAVLAKKPEDLDPLAHPWVFVAESRAGELFGADRVKFVTRRSPDARAVEAVSDIAMVSYVLYPDDVNGDFQLLRWSRPQLPESLDREFPRWDDPNVQLMADRVVGFAVRFLDESGEWRDEWDSSQMLDSSELPMAVEIEIALAPDDPNATLEEIPHYRRRVLLPVRPLDLTTLLDPVAYAALDGEGEASEDCQPKVADCIDFENFNPTPDQLEQLGEFRDVDPNQACWEDFRGAFGGLPMVKPECR